MKITLSSEGDWTLESSIVSLRGLRPVLNGAPLQGARVQVTRSDAGSAEWRYRAPALGEGLFGVEIARENDTRCSLRYWLEGLPETVVLDSFGLQFGRLENLRAYLRNGYYSWDGSFYVDPESRADGETSEASTETGYAMTQLLPRQGSGSLVLGFDRHERFQHTFTFDTRAAPPSLIVQTWWDRKNLATIASPRVLQQGAPSQGSRCESERLVIFEHPGVEDALREWARLVADAASLRPRHAEQITGWCSWYSLYGYITEENILEHLRGVEKVVRAERLPMQVFQIDDGFTPEMGDWLDFKPAFPRGMKPLLDDIRAAGFRPGLWIAPFMVGNRSRLYREHPDWVVQDSAGGSLVQWKLYGEFRWHKRSEEYYILDTTHPDAFEYLRTVFRTWRHEWGCEYFKTDFMFWGAAHGPERAIWHTPGITRIEIWRRMAEMIRAEIGDALWLGCGCPLWASVGLVDGIRIGSDIGVEWRGHLSAQSLLRDQPTRNFANHILWQTDPDCILLRERFHHLNEAEVQSLAVYAGMPGGVVMTSDALDALSPDRLGLWKLLLAPGDCRFPLLGQPDPVLVQVRERDSRYAVFIFNTGERQVERRYGLAALGIYTRMYAYRWNRSLSDQALTDSLSVTLQGHEGALVFLSQRPLEAVPERLP